MPAESIKARPERSRMRRRTPRETSGVKTSRSCPTGVKLAFPGHGDQGVGRAGRHGDLLVRPPLPFGDQGRSVSTGRGMRSRGTTK